MFQFRAFPSCSYLIHCMMTAYCAAVLPHSEISGSTLICSSPKLIAACHVLHRLLMPRHSPCALFSLTYVEENCTSFRPPHAANIHSVPFPSPFSRRTRLRWAPPRGDETSLSSLWFSIKNYAGSTELLNKIVFTLKVPQLKFRLRSFDRALCCLAFSFLFLCSVFKVQVQLTLMVENSGIEPLTS